MSTGSIKIYVGVTDLDWFEYLSTRNPDEVNFWQPGGRSQFRALQPGADGEAFVGDETVLPVEIEGVKALELQRWLFDVRH
ncbi:hypothetical protein D3P06_00695 [Paracoccus aestuarii]|uniref:Uncharacterized protein n=1 Tax=Paracoccus aestuarii TaxID=453842 RepID=A0A419A2H0_9RHOB|nr:hypothetical protein D3P06_00695 [Paracoccus aestuarii]